MKKGWMILLLLCFLPCAAWADELHSGAQELIGTLDLAAIPVMKKLTHLPIIIDPSHAAGKNWLVDKLSMGAVATGTDGLLIEVHNDPAHALCDGPQSIRPEEFDALNRKLLALHRAIAALEE